MNILNLILGLLMVLLTIQTKLGEKARILVYRVEDVIESKSTLKEQQAKLAQHHNQGQQQLSQQSYGQCTIKKLLQKA